MALQYSTDPVPQTLGLLDAEVWQIEGTGSEQGTVCRLHKATSENDQTRIF